MAGTLSNMFGTPQVAADETPDGNPTDHPQDPTLGKGDGDEGYVDPPKPGHDGEPAPDTPFGDDWSGDM